MTISSTLPLFMSSANIKSFQMESLDQGISDNYELTLSENNGTFLDCDAEVRISGEVKINEIKSQERENVKQLARQKKISGQVDDVQKIASSLQRLIMSSGPTCRTKQAFDDQIKGYLSQIEDIMNSEHHGDQTLAGKELKEKSVSITDLPKIKSGQGIDYSYYTGETGTQSVKINDDIHVDLYPITGKHDAFAKTIQGARLMLTVKPSDTKSAAFREARELITEAVKNDFPDATYRVGIEKSKLNDAIGKAPELIILETERILKANKVSQMDAMRITKELEQTRDVALKIMSNNSVLENRNIETIMRSFTGS